MTLLALLRHAETHWSGQGRIQGRTNIALSDDGRAVLQRKTLPAEYFGMRVVTSPLQRCVETAALLELENVSPEPRIAEMSWGEWEGRVLADLRAEYGEKMRENEARGWDFTPPGGESPRSVWRRVSGWLAEVAQSGEATLGITHRGVIRVLMATTMNWDMQGKPPVKLDWNALHVFRLDRRGRPDAICMNLPLVQKRENQASE